MKESIDRKVEHRSATDFYEEWTSGVLNTLFEGFKGTKYEGLPLQGINLIHEVSGEQKKVSVTFVFKEDD